MNSASNVLEANMKDPKGLDTTAVANPGNDDAKFADPSGETMKVSSTSSYMIETKLLRRARRARKSQEG